MLQSMLTARAFENTAAIVFANVGGENTVTGGGKVKLKNVGLSQVSMPFLGSVGTPLGGGEGMAVVDLDLGILEEAEDYYGIRAEMTGASWRYEILGKCDKSR
jgi:predicted amidohydrolase